MVAALFCELHCSSPDQRQHHYKARLTTTISRISTSTYHVKIIYHVHYNYTVYSKTTHTDIYMYLYIHYIYLYIKQK